MNCPQCGGDLADQTFCPHCGAQAAADAGGNPYAIGSQVRPCVVVRSVDALEIPDFSQRVDNLPSGEVFFSQSYERAGQILVLFLMVLVVDLVLFLCFSRRRFFISRRDLSAICLLPLLGATIRRYHGRVPVEFSCGLFCRPLIDYL